MDIGSWKVLDTGVGSAEGNMAFDAALLAKQADKGGRDAILHLYDWDCSCATYGYFIDPFTLLDREAVSNYPLALARRPTGGGVIFHVTDWAFSIVVPEGHPGYSLNVMENYAFVNKLVIEVISNFLGSHESFSLLPTDPVPVVAHASHFCMAKPTKYDVMLNGRKVGGGAQRRTKDGFLHQGTISLAFPGEEMLRQVLKQDVDVVGLMLEHTHSLLAGNPTRHDIEDAREKIKKCFVECVKGR